MPCADPEGYDPRFEAICPCCNHQWEIQEFDIEMTDAVYLICPNCHFTRETIENEGQ